MKLRKVFFRVLVLFTFFILISSKRIYGQELIQNSNSKLIEETKDYQRYYRNYRTEEYTISLTDVVFDGSKLFDLLGLPKNIASVDILENKLSLSTQKLEKQIVEKSGLVVRDNRTKHQVKNVDVNVSNNSIKVSETIGGYSVVERYTLSLLGNEIKISMNAIVPSSYIKESDDEEEDVVESPTEEETIINETVNDKPIAKDTVLNSKIKKEKDKLLLQKLKIKEVKTQLMKTLIAFSKPKSVKIPKLTINLKFKNIITHSYVATFSIGVLIIIYVIVVSIPMFSLGIWYRRKRRKNTYKALRKFIDEL
ncbi:MAG: hypothetical protein LBM02_01495 [Lachnospiraceae bacterium]|jgi:hypothetical protein|nr:hypothetical protein [Lachnospiraceae bacterium]